MSDEPINIMPPNANKLFVCHGYRTIAGLERFRGEVFEGVNNPYTMDALVEMGLVSRTADNVPTTDVEHDGMTRRFVNEDSAMLFLDWVVSKEESVVTVIDESSEQAPETNVDSDQVQGQTEAPDKAPYDEMSKAELSEELDKRSIKYQASMNKSDLIALLVDNDKSANDGDQTEQKATP